MKSLAGILLRQWPSIDRLIITRRINDVIVTQDIAQRKSDTHITAEIDQEFAEWVVLGMGTLTLEERHIALENILN